MINANASFALGYYGLVTAKNTFLRSDGYNGITFTGTQDYTFIIDASSGVGIGIADTS